MRKRQIAVKSSMVERVLEELRHRVRQMEKRVGAVDRRHGERCD